MIRVLWRMQGPSKVVAAGLFAHPLGRHWRELRVYFEPLDRQDVLHTQLARDDFAPLEAKAEEVRKKLLVQGWSSLSVRSGGTSREPAAAWNRTLWVGAVAAVGIVLAIARRISDARQTNSSRGAT